jgi:tRNA nucleotidyltransferase (CCA-adding enzyme)
LDKALHHGLSESSVSTYMWKGPVTIPAELPVEKVRRTMMGNEVGRLLVVDEDRRLLGIITRTDLLKLWPEVPPAIPEVPEDWAARLQESLPGPVWDVLQQAGRLADEVGFSLYVVGGFVRDLLLGLPNLDLDLVVEGDAIALAKELARRYGGRARSHRRFGTAKWILERKESNLPRHLDFVTARTEFYERPTALPTVEISSLRQDLYRRDFTVNTLAIGLSGDRTGRLFDFFGGTRDLERRLVRVLHNLSFIDDPTRILRAVRLEQRLGFIIEPRTMQLLEDALSQGLLERMTGERIRHELLLILEEEEPERALRRLDGLGVLERISPHLIWSDWLDHCFRVVRERASGDERLSLYLALLCYDLPAAEVELMIGRYRFRARHSLVLRQVLRLRREVVPVFLARELSLAEIYHVLEGFSATALHALMVAEGSEDRVREAVQLYMERLRFVHTALGGDDLQRLGLPPGPLYKELLGALLDARLEERLGNREEEEEFLKEQIRIRKQSETGRQDDVAKGLDGDAR